MAVSANPSYYRRLWGAAFTAFGAFMLIEHIYTWGFQFWDFIGHEWLGLLMIVVGVFTAIDFDRAKAKNDVRVILHPRPSGTTLPTS